MNSVIGKDSPLPLYYQLKTHILDLIAAGELQPGQMLPSERQLQEQHEISRATVRQALTELVNEGVLERKQGIGTVVARKKIAPQLLKLTSFTEDMRGRGFTPGSVTLELAHTAPPAYVRDALKLGGHETIQSIYRLRLADDEPIGLQLLYVPPWLGLSDKELADLGSFYQLLKEKCGIEVVRAHEYLNARNATAREARYLHIKAGRALINVERVSYDSKDWPVEYVQFVYRADRYVYDLTLYR